MFYIIHTNLVTHVVKIVDDTFAYANTHSKLIDYVSKKCNAVHIVDDTEVNKIDRFFKVNDDKNKIYIYKSINDGYVYDNFVLKLIEEIDVVKYDNKTKSYLEITKECVNNEVKAFGGFTQKDCAYLAPRKYDERDL